MEKLLLDHMKENHPEWLQKLTDNKNLDHFLRFHVGRAIAYRGESVEDEVLPVHWLEQDMRHYLLIDPIFDSQSRINCPRHKDDPEREESDFKTAREIQAGTELPESKGTVNFMGEGFSVGWDGEGLRVHTISYNSTELLLGWDYIEGLAKAAQKDPVRHG